VHELPEPKKGGTKVHDDPGEEDDIHTLHGEQYDDTEEGCRIRRRISVEIYP